MPDAGDEFSSVIESKAFDNVLRRLSDPALYMNALRNIMDIGGKIGEGIREGIGLRRARAGKSATKEMNEVFDELSKKISELGAEPQEFGPLNSKGWRDGDRIFMQVDFSDNVLADGSKIEDFAALKKDIDDEFYNAGCNGLYDLEIDDAGVGTISFDVKDKDKIQCGLRMVQNMFSARVEENLNSIDIPSEELDKCIYEISGAKEVGMSFEAFRAGGALNLAGDELDDEIREEWSGYYDNMKAEQVEILSRAANEAGYDLRCKYVTDTNSYRFEFPKDSQESIAEIIDNINKKNDSIKSMYPGREGGVTADDIRQAFKEHAKNSVKNTEAPSVTKDVTPTRPQPSK